MSPIWSRVAWSAVGLAVYAPIPLLTAFPSLAPPAFRDTFNGVPIGVWFIAGTIVTIVTLTWAGGAGAKRADAARGGTST